MTLLEIIIVISLVALVYAVGAPNLLSRSQSEIYLSLSQFTTSVRTAFDLSVLKGQPYRMRINLATGEYFLETPVRELTRLKVSKVASDMEEDLSGEKEGEFEALKEDLEAEAPAEVVSLVDESKVAPISPVLKKLSFIAPVKWALVESLEWGKKRLGSDLVFQDLRAEHHTTLQVLAEMGEKAYAYLYFFPNGYVEKAVFHITEGLGGTEINDSAKPYTLTTNSLSGTVDIRDGYEELEFNNEI